MQKKIILLVFICCAISAATCETREADQNQPIKNVESNPDLEPTPYIDEPADPDPEEDTEPVPE